MDNEKRRRRRKSGTISLRRSQRIETKVRSRGGMLFRVNVTLFSDVAAFGVRAKLLQCRYAALDWCSSGSSSSLSLLVLDRSGSDLQPT